MKRFLTLSFLSILASVSLFGQDRLVFIEEFTQASCPPCEATTPALNEVLNANADKIVQIRYHTSWPGVDPMNADNPAEVQTRVDYYGVTGVPNVRIDGAEAVGAGNQLVTPAEIDARSGVSSPVSMELSHSLNDDNSQMMITVSITNNGSDAYAVSANRLRVAVVEEEVSWPFTPGSTSLTTFEAVMKEFVTGAGGMMIPEIAGGETWTESWMIDVPATTYSLFELAAVAWLQDDQSREVVNAAESHPVPLNGDYVDAGAKNNTEAGSFCDETIQPSVVLTNNGSVDITSAEVNVVVDGEIVATETYSGTIAPNASETFLLSEVAATPGGGTYSFAVGSVNGETDVNRLNSITTDLFIGTFSEFTELNDGFESYSFNDEGPFIVEAPNLVFTTVTPAAFGQDTPNVGSNSANSVLIDFWTWQDVGADAYMYFGEVDFSEAVTPTLTFDHTGSRFQNSNDRLAVEVSTDCGDTWAEVWFADGAALGNNGNNNSARFIPTPSTLWVSNEIMLDNYAGESAVSLRFKATTDYGNASYIDNVVLNALSVSNDEVVDKSLASIFPNPVNSTAIIQVELASASDVTLQVSDISGKVLDTKFYGNLSGTNTLRYDVDALTEGLYIFNIVAGDIVSPQRVSVIK